MWYFFDGRSIPQKSKSECSSEEIVGSIFTQLAHCYPSAILIKLPESEYYKKALPAGHTTIKIGIAAYHAGFGSDISVGIGSVGGHFTTGIYAQGQWNALTSFYVQIFDNGKYYSKEISNSAGRSNMWGYKSARAALNECYNKSINELLFFLDESLMN